MLGRIGKAHRQPVLLRHTLCILHTEVELITSHSCRIVARERVDIRIAVTVGDGTVVLTPKVRDVGTHRQSLHWHVTQTHISLMESLIALIGIGVIVFLGFFVHPSRHRIVVAHIGERQDTEAHTHVAESTESSDHIVQVGILGVLLHAVLIEVADLTRDAGIEKECQRVDRRIRSRVDIIYLIVLMKAKSHSIHTSIETRSLVGQQAQPPLTVWRIHAALGIHCQSQAHHESCQK